MNSSPSSNYPTDPLSEILSLLALNSARCTRLEAGGDWALHFPEVKRLKLVAVLRGAVWIVLRDQPPHLLQAGDTFLLTDTPYVVASQPDQRTIDGSLLYAESQPNILQIGGDEALLIGGGFTFSDTSTQLLIDSLPKFMLIPAAQPAAAVMRDTLAMLDGELQSGEMGASLMAKRLADILLVQVLRAYVAEYGMSAAGWLGALSDARIGRAITLMHRDIGHGWTVEELASRVAMSRSGFALRFKSMVGMAPLEYLRHWRMQVAKDALRRRSGSVQSIAASLGYTSESAFGNAYKRMFGQSPMQHRIG